MKATHNACNIDIEFEDGEQQAFVFDKENGEKLFLPPWISLKANGVLVKIPATALKLDELEITEINPEQK